MFILAVRSHNKNINIASSSLDLYLLIKSRVSGYIKLKKSVFPPSLSYLVYFLIKGELSKIPFLHEFYTYIYYFKISTNA